MSWEITTNGGPASTVMPAPSAADMLSTINERTKVLVEESSRLNVWKTATGKRLEALEASSKTIEQCLDAAGSAAQHAARAAVEAKACAEAVTAVRGQVARIDAWVERQEKRQTETEAKVADVAEEAARVDKLAQAHDKLYKPSVIARNGLMFAGGILAYIGHLLLKHLDSVERWKGLLP